LKVLASANGSVISPPEGAVWIGPAHAFDLADAYLNFRADVDLAEVPDSALFHIAADSRYRLWVNGAFVGRGAERSWPSSMAVDVHEVAGLLRPGMNRVAVQVFSPGHSHFAYVHRGACGLIAWAPGLVSGPHWRVRRDRSWAERVARVSIYGTAVEDRDMRLAQDWQEADAGGWEAARVVQGATGPIWGALRERMTPQPVEEMRALEVPEFLALGPSVAGSGDPHQDLRAVFAGARFLRRNRDETFEGFDAEFPKIPPSPGDTRVFVFDLGESRACIAGAEVVAEGGEVLLVSYAEKLRDGMPLLSDPATYCRMRPTDRFTLRAGRQMVEGFTPRGARYVILALTGRAEARFFARLPRYPLAQRPPSPTAPHKGEGAPEPQTGGETAAGLGAPPPLWGRMGGGALAASADSEVRAIAEMCRRTTLACLQDGFVDGVWRESSLWLGDAVAQDWALRALSDDPRPLLFALDMAAEGQDGEGLLPSVLPGEIPAYVVTDYNFSWVELLAGCASHPGIADAQALWRRHWPVLQRMLARFALLRQTDGLIRNPPGRRLFLDWSGMDRGEPNLTLNLRYLHALRLGDAMAVRLGVAEPWGADAATLSDAIRAQRVPVGWRERPGGAEASQLALAFLILTGLSEDPGAMADRIVARSLAALDAPGPALASPFMHHYLFQALDLLGRRGDIRDIIAHRWGAWGAAGDVTTRENWLIDFPDGSAAHGFSAHPLGWLLQQ